MELNTYLCENKRSIEKRSEKNPMWKGERVGYIALHDWIHRRKYKPELCESCKKKKRLDLANISQKYKRDVTDWEWLCRKCHMIKDGRMEKWYLTHEARRKYHPFCKTCGVKFYPKKGARDKYCSNECSNYAMSLLMRKIILERNENRRFCKNGHRWIKDNIHISWSPTKKITTRYCIICKRERERVYKRKQRNKQNGLLHDRIL